MRCPICRESHALISVVSPTDDVLYRCSECGALGSTLVWDTLYQWGKTIDLHFVNGVDRG